MIKMLLLLISLTNLTAQAAQVCDFNSAAHKQLELVKKISDYEIEMAGQLMLEASQPFDKDDKIAKKINLFKIKLASERFMKHQYLNEVSLKMDETVSTVRSLESFQSFHGNAGKAKFYLKNSAQIFKSWIQGAMLNTATMKSLKKEIRSELIETGLKAIGGEVLSKITDDEALILTYATDISVKAGMEFGGQLLAGQALRYGGTEMFLGWAGGPAGVAVILGQLFLSGTLPEETKWTDITEKYPELTLMPEKMIETPITKDPKRAMIIHCWAWERREYFMNDRGAKIIKKDQDRIKKMIRGIEMEPYYEAQRARLLIPQRDNTYVRPPVLLQIKSR